MKEVYRSFDGKLDINNQYGYIVYDLEKYYEIQFLSVDSPNAGKIRIKKEYMPDDFSDEEKIAELQTSIEDGCTDAGQCFYRGKWYSFDKISKIQAQNQDYNWKKFVAK
jgi:hypothetical protein